MHFSSYVLFVGGTLFAKNRLEIQTQKSNSCKSNFCHSSFPFHNFKHHNYSINYVQRNKLTGIFGGDQSRRKTGMSNPCF